MTRVFSLYFFCNIVCTNVFFFILWGVIRLY
jgi:hypothetical protein